MTILVTNNRINDKVFFKGNRDKNFGGIGYVDSRDDQVSFEKYNIPPKTDKKLERKVFATTLLGISTALLVIMKRKGYSLNPSKIFAGTVKNFPEKLNISSAKQYLKSTLGHWGLFNVKQYNELNIIGMATGSIIGGLIGGFAFDKKENKHAKIRESVIQMVGNILTPVAFVSAGARTYNHFKPSIMEKMPKLEGTSFASKFASKLLRYAPSFGIVGAFLAGGILSGNYIGNTINNKCFNVEQKRKIKLADFSAHIDDVCLAASLVASGGPFAFITKIVPAALMVAGVSTGVAQSTNAKYNNISKQ